MKLEQLGDVATAPFEPIALTGDATRNVELGITELDLSYSHSIRKDNGIAVALLSCNRTAEQQTHEIAGMWIAKPAPAGPKLDELLASTSDEQVLTTSPQAAAPAGTADYPTGVIAQTAITASVIYSSGGEELLRNQTPLS